jgi:hypothetical protein
MTAKTNPNEPAFTIVTDGAIDAGLSKLEYFAALALQGCLASCTDNYPSPDYVAKRSVQYAKALIEELNNPEN